MAGAGLIAIKRRIKSVTNTRKITKAMGLVATSKLRKIRGQLAVADEYHKSLEKTKNLVLNSLDDIESTLIIGNNSNKKLYIVITSDSGLCGGYNAAVVASAVESIKEDINNSNIITVGEKGRVYFRKYGLNTLAEYVDIPDVPTTKESKTIFNHAVDLYKKGEIGEINIVYTKFVSPVKQIPVIEKLLPLSVEETESLSDTIVIEPSAYEISDDIMLMYLQGSVHFAMTHAKCSEHASRMSSMDGATKNADDILDGLNLKYNRIRQSAITQEISEIVGGAEAQK